MKQPTVIVDGVEHKLLSISWYENGAMSHFSVDGETIFPPNVLGTWRSLNDDDTYTYHNVQFKEEIK